MRKKKIRKIIILECTDCYSNSNKRTYGISRYITEKNKQKTIKRLSLKKYCKFCNKSSIHKEIK
uniref:Ribosomal protein L33 n=1 Tax=Nitzschia sp. IriIs04 TaxID=1444690 RepID=A0A0S3QPL3_9STRA|nr:ribosomal protein L33 [Nitzschia sp. IriIs04]BAT70262.1 ribosomal protein L33 [Nitzschia sp. IriIs04]